MTVSSGRAKSISRWSCRMMKKMRKNLDRSIDFCRRLCPPRATSEWAMHFHFRHLPDSRVYDHCSFNDRILGQSMGNKFVGRARQAIGSAVSHGMKSRSDDFQTSIQIQFQPSPIDLYRPQNAFPSSLAPDSSAIIGVGSALGNVSLQIPLFH